MASLTRPFLRESERGLRCLAPRYIFTADKSADYFSKNYFPPKSFTQVLKDCRQIPFLLQFSSFGKNRFKVFWLNLQLNRKTYSAVFTRNLKISRQKRIRRQSP